MVICNESSSVWKSRKSGNHKKVWNLIILNAFPLNPKKVGNPTIVGTLSCLNGHVIKKIWIFYFSLRSKYFFGMKFEFWPRCSKCVRMNKTKTWSHHAWTVLYCQVRVLDSYSWNLCSKFETLFQALIFLVIWKLFCSLASILTNMADFHLRLNLMSYNDIAILSPSNTSPNVRLLCSIWKWNTKQRNIKCTKTYLYRHLVLLPGFQKGRDIKAS
jgi:hypothetical protein